MAPPADAPTGAIAAAGIVLVGGRSTRMGEAKATLPWGAATLVEHVLGVVADAVRGPVVVVRAPGQALPALGAAVRIVDDPVEGRGPLQGLAAGLAAVAGTAAVAYVSAVDLPFLRAELVRAVVAGLDDDCDVAVPVVGGHRQPLAAAYRTALAPLVAEVVAAGGRGSAALYARCRVRELPEASLPHAAAALRDVDTPAELRAARTARG